MPATDGSQNTMWHQILPDTHTHTHTQPVSHKGQQAARCCNFAPAIKALEQGVPACVLPASRPPPPHTTCETALLTKPGGAISFIIPPCLPACLLLLSPATHLLMVCFCVASWYLALKLSNFLADLDWKVMMHSALWSGGNASSLDLGFFWTTCKGSGPDPKWKPSSSNAVTECAPAKRGGGGGGGGGGREALI